MFGPSAQRFGNVCAGVHCVIVRLTTVALLPRSAWVHLSVPYASMSKAGDLL